MRIRVVFSEALSARPIHVADKLLAFQTALRLTFRTKWEFVEGFKRATSKEDVSRAEHLLNTLEAEAALDGSSDEELLTSCFEEKEANTLKGMFEEWRKLRGADDGSDSGSSLANAFRTGDAKMLRACLNTLERINTRYASMAAKRLPYIVREYWR